MLDVQRSKDANRQHAQLLGLLDSVEEELPAPLPLTTRELVAEWVRQYMEGSCEAEMRVLISWAQEIIAQLEAMDTSDPDIAYAVEVHDAIAVKIAGVGEDAIQRSLDAKWRDDHAAYQQELAPLVAELRKFIAIEAPGLGAPTGWQMEEALRAGKMEWVEQWHNIAHENITQFNAALEARGGWVGIRQATAQGAN